MAFLDLNGLSHFLDKLKTIFARNDGSYSSLTAGNAEQLVSTVGVNDKTPYLFRTTGGSADVGDRVKLSEITGGTVAWNQLVQNGDFSDGSSGWTAQNSSYSTASMSDGVAAITCVDPSAPSDYYNGIKRDIPRTPAYHKILYVAEYKPKYAHACGTYLIRHSAVTGTNFKFFAPCSAGVWNTVAGILVPTNDVGSVQALSPQQTSSGYAADDIDYVRNVRLFDLTAMFGSTIADYIYSLEQNTAGAGVAWFRKLFPKPYYAYDAGSLQSVNTSAHNMVGFNAWDEEWEVGNISSGTGGNSPDANKIRSKNHIHVVPNTQYFVTVAGGAKGNFVYFEYDADKNYLGTQYSVNNGYGTFTTTANACYIRFRLTDTYGSTYHNDICINLSWDGERDGEYEPYEVNTYALDDVELRGIPKLDANNNLYYDGDSYAPDGTVTRRYGIVDLGTLTWTRWKAGDIYILEAAVQGKKGERADNCRCPLYTCDAVLSDGWGGMKNMTMTGVNGQQKIFIRNDDYSDVASFKTAMSGVMLVYELATPTTESADPYQETQICNDFGTEEFVDSRTVPMPVGNSALYQANLRAKLEMAPDSPDGDGDYIVRQNDGLNEYVAVSDNSTISGLVTRCPACPTDTDGNFVLKAVVSSGSVTYSWVAEA